MEVKECKCRNESKKKQECSRRKASKTKSRKGLESKNVSDVNSEGQSSQLQAVIWIPGFCRWKEEDPFQGTDELRRREGGIKERNYMSQDQTIFAYMIQKTPLKKFIIIWRRRRSSYDIPAHPNCIGLIVELINPLQLKLWTTTSKSQ